MELLLQVLQPLLGLVKGILKRQSGDQAGVLLAEPEEQSSHVGTKPHRDLVPECNAKGLLWSPEGIQDGLALLRRAVQPGSTPESQGHHVTGVWSQDLHGGHHFMQESLRELLSPRNPVPNCSSS